MEFYAAARRRLAEHGILQQWIPDGDRPLLSAVVAAVSASFRHVRLFGSMEGWGLHILASQEPIAAASAEELAARMPAAAVADLLEWGPATTAAAQLQLVLDREVPLVRLVPPGTEPLRDDRPLNEYFYLRMRRARAAAAAPERQSHAPVRRPWISSASGRWRNRSRRAAGRIVKSASMARANAAAVTRPNCRTREGRREQLAEGPRRPTGARQGSGKSFEEWLETVVGAVRDVSFCVVRAAKSTSARRSNFGAALALSVIALLAGPLAASATGDEPLESPWRATRTAASIHVDGVLDEAAWQEAETISLAYETQPGENTPAPIATRCRFFYDTERLYVGCHAEDPQPEAIRARFTDRDQAYDGDFVGIRLDPFLDRRRSFEFYVNPLGVQMDLFRDDLKARQGGGDNSEDTSWDAIWDSAGRITADGYEVELAIPFSSLRFPTGGETQTWGIGFLRIQPRRDRLELSSEPSDRNRNCAVCQLSTATGFAEVSPGRHLELDPTLTIQRADKRPVVPDGALEAGKVEVDPGLTVTWGVTPDIILSGTLNPDFSQVEADALQLDVNQQFALFYPERRPFFLEGADLFATPFQIVSTRNVADPDWGAKVTGKRDRNAFGAFVAEDARTSLLIPGSERSQVAELDVASTNAVVRYRRDLGANSVLGVVATSREGGDYSNQVVGFDGLVRLGAVDSLRFQALGSHTKYPVGIVEGYDQPVGSFSDDALYFSYNHDSRDWRLSAAYQDVGRDFRADLGFLPQIDRRYGKALVEHSWWAAPESRWIKFSLGFDSARTDDQKGAPLERLNELWFIFRGRRRVQFLRPSGRPGAHHRRTAIRRALHRRADQHSPEWLARASSRLERRRRRRPRAAAAGQPGHPVAGAHLGARAPPAGRARASLSETEDRPGLAVHRSAHGAAPGLAAQPPQLPPRHSPVPRSRARSRPLYLPDRCQKPAPVQPTPLLLPPQPADRVLSRLLGHPDRDRTIRFSTH